jgi:hypothetical protein
MYICVAGCGTSWVASSVIIRPSWHRSTAFSTSSPSCPADRIWKGAISFGLVHIPVSLVSATSSQGVDFDWLDKRSMDPVGYKRINKTTGKEVTKDNIVKGVAFEKGRYVVLSEEEIRSAHPKSYALLPGKMGDLRWIGSYFPADLRIALWAPFIPVDGRPVCPTSSC